MLTTTPFNYNEATSLFRTTVQANLAPYHLTAFTANNENYGEMNTISSRILAQYNVTGASFSPPAEEGEPKLLALGSLDLPTRIEYDDTPLRVDDVKVARDIGKIDAVAGEPNITTVANMVQTIKGLLPPHEGKMLVFGGRVVILDELLALFAKTALASMGTNGVLITHPKSGVFKYYGWHGHHCLLLSLRFNDPVVINGAPGNPGFIEKWGGLDQSDTSRTITVDATETMAKVAETYRVTREGLRHFREDINTAGVVRDSNTGASRMLGSSDYVGDAIQKILVRAARRISIGQIVNVSQAFAVPSATDAELGDAVAQLVVRAGVSGGDARRMPVTAYFNPTSVLGVWARNSVSAGN